MDVFIILVILRDFGKHFFFYMPLSKSMIDNHVFPYFYAVTYSLQYFTAVDNCVHHHLFLQRSIPVSLCLPLLSLLSQYILYYIILLCVTFRPSNLCYYMYTRRSENVKLTNPAEVTKDYRINLSYPDDDDDVDDEIRIGIKFSTVPPIIKSTQYDL